MADEEDLITILRRRREEELRQQQQPAQPALSGSDLIDELRRRQPLEKQLPLPEPPPDVTTADFQTPRPGALLPPGRTARGLGIEKFTDLVTGRKSDPRYRDVPELGTSGSTWSPFGTKTEVGPFDPRGATLLAGNLFARDPKMLRDIALKTLDGSKADVDADGNPMIIWNNKRYYVNKPGFSQSDAMKFAGDLITLAPVFRVVSAVPGVVGRMVGMGGGAGLTSIARDKVAEGLGANVEAGDILGNAALEAGIGAATQGVVEAGPAIKGAFNAVREKLPFLPQPSRVPVDDKLIASGRGLIEKAGLKTDTYSPADLQMVGRGYELAEKAGLTPGAYHPEQLKSFASWENKVRFDKLDETIRTVAANMREDPGGPLAGFRLTRGQRTGNEPTLRNEAVTRAGARGTPGQQALQIAEADRLQAIRDAARDISGGGKSEIGVGTDLLAGTQGAAEKSRAGYRKLYDEAGTFDLLFTPHGLEQLNRDLDKGFANRLLSDTLTPATKGAIAHVKEQTAKTLPGSNIPRPMSLEEIDLLRQEVTGLPAANAKDAAGIYRVRKILDDWMDDAVSKVQPRVASLGDDAATQAALPFSIPPTVGDTPAVDALKKARAAFNVHKEKFAAADTSDRAGKTIERWLENGLTGQQVVDGVFGAGELSGRGNTVAMVNRLNRIFGADSPYMKGVQDAALTRILYGARSTGDITDIGAGTLAKNIRRQVADNEAFSALFPGAKGDETRRVLLQFADHLEATTKSGRGGTPGLSTSGTDVGTEALKRNLVKLVPGIGPVVDRFIGGTGAGKRIAKDALGSTTEDIVRGLLDPGPRLRAWAASKAKDAAVTAPQTLEPDLYDQMFGGQ